MSGISHIPVARVDAKGEEVMVKITGLMGGHSGAEIDKNRANANKLLGTFLYSLRKTTDYELISVQGGQKDNAITREAEAKLLIDAKELENVKAFAAELQKAWREEYTRNR